MVAAATSVVEKQNPVCAFCGLFLSHATTNEDLVRNLLTNRVLTRDQSAEAFLKVDRARFVEHISGRLCASDEHQYCQSADINGAGETLDVRIYSTKNDSNLATLDKNADDRVSGVTVKSEPKDMSWLYYDSPVELPLDTTTIESGLYIQMSAPHVHATMIELVAEFLETERKPLRQPGGRHNQSGCEIGDDSIRILDVGSGTGYFAVLMAKLCELLSDQNLLDTTNFYVVGVERVTEVNNVAKRVAERHFPCLYRKHFDLITEDAHETLSKSRHGDAADDESLYGQERAATESGNLSNGEKQDTRIQDENLYDVIHFGCALEEIDEGYLKKLKRPGRLIAPVGPAWEKQILTVVDVDKKGNIDKKDGIAVIFVPFLPDGTT